MSRSKIEWTEVSWNPTTGCTKISDGCKNCYAENLSYRLKAMGNPKYKKGFEVKTHEATLMDPFKWKKPRIVFVNSMSDLFHDEIPNDFILKVFEVMNSTPHHTYQILTKRIHRALLLNDRLVWSKNIWMGVTIENSKYIERLNGLNRISTENRFVSFEPLLSRISGLDLTGVKWVIVGGESGANSREIKKSWVEYILNQCLLFTVPFFFKQWGNRKYNPNKNDPTIIPTNSNHAKGGCSLNGIIYHQYPKF